MDFFISRRNWWIFGLWEKVMDLFLNGLFQYPFRMSAETLSDLVYPGFLQQIPRQHSDYATVISTQNVPDSSLRNYPWINVVTEKKFRFVFAFSHLRTGFNRTVIYCHNKRVSTTQHLVFVCHASLSPSTLTISEHINSQLVSTRGTDFVACDF